MNEINVKLKFTDDELEQIKELRDRLKLNNSAEVIAYAVSLLFRIEESRKMGNKVQFKPYGYFPSGSTATFEK